MFDRHSRQWIGAVLAAVAMTGGIGAQIRASRGEAERFKQKVAAIAQRGSGPVSPKAFRTPVTENELNAFLAYEIRDQLPPGIGDPSVTILGTGRLSGRATVDLDAVRRHKKPTGLFDPMRFLSGQLPITATGTLTTGNGVGRFDLESAAVGGVPVPKIVLQEIVGYYSRAPDRPSGIGLDDPFALPAQIREIQVERGQAVIVQ